MAHTANQNGFSLLPCPAPDNAFTIQFVRVDTEQVGGEDNVSATSASPFILHPTTNDKGSSSTVPKRNAGR